MERSVSFHLRGKGACYGPRRAVSFACFSHVCFSWRSLGRGAPPLFYGRPFWVSHGLAASFGVLAVVRLICPGFQVVLCTIGGRCMAASSIRSISVSRYK